MPSDNLTERMEQQWGDISQKILTSLAIEAYQSQLISTAELGEILNLPSRLEVHQFLKDQEIYLNYDEDELNQDITTINQLRHQYKGYTFSKLLQKDN